MIRIILGCLLAVSASNALADSMYFYKNSDGKILLTNRKPSGKYANFNKQVKVTHYRNTGNSVPNTTEKDIVKKPVVKAKEKIYSPDDNSTYVNRNPVQNYSSLDELTPNIRKDDLSPNVWKNVMYSMKSRGYIYTDEEISQAISNLGNQARAREKDIALLTSQLYYEPQKVVNSYSKPKNVRDYENYEYYDIIDGKAVRIIEKPNQIKSVSYSTSKDADYSNSAYNALK